MASVLQRQRPVSPVRPEEVSATRQPTERASTLPPRVYHDPEVFQYERDAWFSADWLCVGREEDAAEPGEYFLTQLFGENIIVVRSDDRQLRAFHNVCRHRGATIVEEPCGKLVRFQCPYHAWIYDLKGNLRPPRHTETLENFDLSQNGLFQVRLDTWAGFIFLNLDPQAAPLAEHLGEFPNHWQPFPIAELRRSQRMEYHVKANWKALVENYSECYHCPGVHPLLNHLTPYNLGGYLPGSGNWAASWMELTSDYETLSIDGYLHGRKRIPGMRPEDLKRVYYAFIWPNLLYSLHPDFLMIHLVWPINAEESTVICELFFHPETMAEPDFDPSGPKEFWDLTNRQDWHVCELQQAGTASRSYVPGRYSIIEKMVHSFDAMVADRYANDGQRTVVVREAIKNWGGARTKRRSQPAELRESAD
ncbi:MAG: (2Fe-2S)-binding protein [Chloroflexi bacterium]|nr:MAG: (2Fe-2S)-binding protein [Chloroflexota bacterium]